MKRKKKEVYSDFSNVTKQRNIVIPEEFPEGSFGQMIDHDKLITEVKSTPWHEGQQSISAYTYADKKFHAGIPRQTPGAHPLHDGQSEVDPPQDD